MGGKLINPGLTVTQQLILLSLEKSIPSLHLTGMYKSYGYKNKGNVQPNNNFGFKMFINACWFLWYSLHRVPTYAVFVKKKPNHTYCLERQPVCAHSNTPSLGNT